MRRAQVCIYSTFLGSLILKIAAEVQAMIADVQSNVIKFQSQLSDSSVQRVNVKVDEMQNLLQDVNIGHEKLKQAALTFAKEAVELFRSAINK